MGSDAAIPVVDLFAGPGGLGEGFSSLTSDDGRQPFRVVLSVEKDSCAHQTLRLRSFFRQFERDDVPDEYYDVLRRNLPLCNLEERLKGRPLAAWRSAGEEALCVELGSSDDSRSVIRKRIHTAIGRKGSPWVLIGGPPCQAYSVVGRVRNSGIPNYRIEKDQRSSLYREYLRIIADHWPAVFIMENVRGLLSATMANHRIFDRILTDLESPLAAFGESARPKANRRYRVVPLIRPAASLLHGVWRPEDFLVPSEKYGVPQIRHRVFLIGIREDLGDDDLPALTPAAAPTVADVIGDLPPLRSGLSRTRTGSRYVALKDSVESWRKTLIDLTVRTPEEGEKRWLKSIGNGAVPSLGDEIRRFARNPSAAPHDRGGEFIRCKVGASVPDRLQAWYIDDRLGGACNHEARTHLDTDLARYLFAACYAKVHGQSPRLSEFPADLLPKHLNAETGDFDDRFRVQVADRPATTITSHISKDGHYFIHPDPTQCRSLTVREAARLQTFPDNYLFCGPRTSQYVQVGNAVPPLLAAQIARCVWGFLVSFGGAV